MATKPYYAPTGTGLAQTGGYPGEIRGKQATLPGVRSGISHANRGKGFEAEVGIYHVRYRVAGAYVQRNPTPLKVIGADKAGVFKAVPDEDAPPDYLIAHEGLVVLMDAKETVEERWQLKNLHPHQADAFTFWSNTGPTHRAGIVLRVEGISRGCCWWVDWAELRPVYERWRIGGRACGRTLTRRAGAANARVRAGARERHDGSFFLLLVVGDGCGAPAHL